MPARRNPATPMLTIFAIMVLFPKGSVRSVYHTEPWAGPKERSMKIISGSSKRRTFSLIDSPTVRPTKERIRQALFNVLVHRFAIDFAQTAVLDGFGGTGAFSFEAASRGAQTVWCVEKDPATARLIQENGRRLGMDRTVRVMIADLLSFQAPVPLGLAFLDPPYDEGLVIPALQHLLPSIEPGAIVVIECRKRDAEALKEKALAFSEVTFETVKTYGKIALLFFRNLGKQNG